MAPPTLTRAAVAGGRLLSPGLVDSGAGAARRFGALLAGALALPLMLVLAAVMVVLGARYEQTTATDQSIVRAGVGVPAALLPVYNEAASVYHVNAFLLASVHKQETDFNQAPDTFTVNGSGCAGPMQISSVPGSPCGCLWCQTSVRNAYRHGERPDVYPDERGPHPSVYDTFDAVMAAAVILRGKVGGRPIPNLDSTARRALCGYYGACADAIAGGYADQVLTRARGWEAVTEAVPQINASGYTAPFRRVVLGRTDQGVDLALTPGDGIRAIGNAQVIGILSNWFNGQPFIWYELLDGPQAHKFVYVAEQITPLVAPGQFVAAGQAIGRYAAHGTALETGWATAAGQTLARATTGYTEGQVTPAGLSFRSFLKALLA